ncbi:MAG: carboxypeptidase-like regulatory domain-containing protein, partial [Sphingobacterium sp.]
MKRSILFIVSILLFFTAFGQKADRIFGKIMVDQSVVAKDAIVRLLNTPYQGRTNAAGEFFLDRVPPGGYILQVSLNDIELLRENIQVDSQTTVLPTIYGIKNNYYLDGVTVYGYRRNKFLERDSSKVAKVQLGYMENPQSYSNVNKELMK